MSTIGTLGKTVPSAYAGSQASAQIPGDDKATQVSQAVVLPENQVSLSASSNGKSLLMTRFMHAAADANPPVETVDKAGGFTPNYLTLQDRDNLAKLYDFASENGIDLAHVDALAGDLAIYRRSLEKSGAGEIYDTDGHKVTYAFTEREAQVATRILSSDDLNSTSLDHGFVREVLDPTQMPVHATNLKFLEKAIEVLSPKGDAGQVSASSAPPGFQASDKWAASDKVLELKSPDIQLGSATQTRVGDAPQMSRQEIIKKLAAELLGKSAQASSTYDILLSGGAKSSTSASPTQSSAQTLLGQLTESLASTKADTSDSGHASVRLYANVASSQ